MLLARFSGSIALLLAASLCFADETPPKTEVSKELRELIEKLDADDFADRQAASDELGKKGKEAIPALEQAIRGDSLEASTRSFELLERLFEKGDGEAKAAAKSALERFAKGNDSAARRAKQLLEPPKPQANAGGAPPGIRIPLGGIRVLPAIAVRRTVKVSTNNGVKTIDVDDNGKKFKLIEDPDKGIEGEITETKEGKEATEKFAAKDVDELKKKHPEAHKLYEQYAKGGGIRVEIGGGFGGRLAPAAPTKDDIEVRLKRLDKQLKEVKDDPGLPAEVRTKRIEALERLLKRYEETLKEVEDE